MTYQRLLQGKSGRTKGRDCPDVESRVGVHCASFRLGEPLCYRGAFLCLSLICMVIWEESGDGNRI